MCKKRVLFFAMSDSVHAVRWISQITDIGWDVRVFPCEHSSIHPDFNDVVIYEYMRSRNAHVRAKRKGFYIHSYFIKTLLLLIIKRLRPHYYRSYLLSVIKKFKPDVIHSLETQHSGYLAMEAIKCISGHRPTWVHTNWGSDIYLFGRFDEHSEKITELLKACDYYTCECRRDIALAKEFGYSGKFFPVYPNSGGLDLGFIEPVRKNVLPSQRKVIMLKGYQGITGRGLVAIRALSRVKDLLGGYKIIIHSNPDGQDVYIAAKLLEQDAQVEVEILPFVSHKKILEYHGQSRISIGLSVSDAISTSLIEAMAMGSFPIQSFTSAADEWIIDGETGILVHPEDPEDVERALRTALIGDDMVDDASEKNWNTITARLDCHVLKKKTIDMYKSIMNT